MSDPYSPLFPEVTSPKANVKQVLTIILAILMFGDILSGLKVVGIFLTLVGGAWYGLEDYREKQPQVYRPEKCSASRIKGYSRLWKRVRRFAVFKGVDSLQLPVYLEKEEVFQM